jgi:hypothetical protein
MRVREPEVRAYAMLAVLVGLGTPSAAQVPVAEPVPPGAEELYRQGLIPIGIAVIDEMPYPEASAVLIRRTEQAPHDIILLATASASGELLQQAIFTMYAAHRLDSACPTQPGVIRVSTQSGTQPPLWSSRDAARLRGVLPSLMRRPTQVLDGYGDVRMTELWVRRFWNDPGDIVPTVPPTGVC